MTRIAIAVTPTNAQLTYIMDLISAVEEPVECWAETTRSAITDGVKAGTFTKQHASRTIDSLRGMKRKPRPTAMNTGTQSSTAITRDGMYRNPSTGKIFKVQKAAHGSGKLYAKLLTMEEIEDGWKARFQYAPGMIRDLRPEWRMTLADAKEFGALYGTCLRCGATLTREESIDRAMGLVCAGKANWA